MENMVTMFDELKKIYEGKRIFLTGHTGFKGSWLLKILSLLGAEVKGYSLAPDNDPNLYTIINGDSLCDSVIADLRDKERLRQAIISFKPDFVFHLAAQPLVRQAYERPSETFEINAIGTANVLDGIALLDNICNAVFITTDKVYHNNEWEYPYRENDRLGGYDPYSASKACAELVIDSYRNSFFNIQTYTNHKKAIAVGRAGNVIGGGDWSKDRLIPDLVKALNNNKTVEIRNPNAVRPWQHVLEPLVGYLILGEKLSNSPELFSQAYNFGPNLEDALPVNKMVSMAVKCWGDGSFVVKKERNQPHEAGLLKLDINKTKKELNWLPRMNAQQAIEYTINWYKSFYDKSSVIENMEMQIRDFLVNY